MSENSILILRLQMNGNKAIHLQQRVKKKAPGKSKNATFGTNE